MTNRMYRWSLLLLLIAAAGCAPKAGMRRVDRATWQSVPDAQRAEVDRAHQPELTRAVDEHRRAAIAAEEAEGLLATQPAPAPVTAVAALPAPIAGPAEGQNPGPTLDEASMRAEATWREASRDHEAALAKARREVDVRKRAWQESNARFRVATARAAELRVAMLDASYELARAQLVSDRARGDQPYEVSGYRGQFARLERAWSDARDQASLAHKLHDQRLSALTAAKAEYAELRRESPPAPKIQVASSKRR
jgi:hypothetical protein